MTSNSAMRLQLAQGIMSLAESGAIVLAHMNHQIDWGFEEFLAGAKEFTPFELYNREAVRGLLEKASSLPAAFLEMIARKREAERASWDSMHQGGRSRLQMVLASGVPVPNAHDWVVMIGSSEFAADLLIDVLSPRHCEALQGREQEYIKWNPICRCYIEQLLLAIRRHGIEPPNASSKKGPKWADHFHAAFVGVVDFLVTDDQRLRRVLRQHQELRPDGRWMVMGLSEFLQAIQFSAEGASGEEGVGNQAARWKVPLAAREHHH